MRSIFGENSLFRKSKNKEGGKSLSGRDKGKNKEGGETYSSAESRVHKPVDEVRASFEESRIGSSRVYGDGGHEGGNTSDKAEGFAERDARKLLEEVAKNIHNKKNRSADITSLDFLKEDMNKAKAIEKEYKDRIDNIDKRLGNFQSPNEKIRSKSLEVALRKMGYEQSREIKAIIHNPNRLQQEIYDPLKAEKLDQSAMLQHKMGPYVDNMRQDRNDLRGIKQAITKVVPKDTKGIDTGLLQKTAIDAINELEKDLSRYIERYKIYEPYYQSTEVSTTSDYGPDRGNRYNSLPPA